MTKDEVKTIIAEALASGDFTVEVDDQQVEALIDKRVKVLTEINTRLHERIKVLEAKLAAPAVATPVAPTRIDAIRESAARVKVRLGGKGEKAA